MSTQRFLTYCFITAAFDEAIDLHSQEYKTTSSLSSIKPNFLSRTLVRFSIIFHAFFVVSDDFSPLNIMNQVLILLYAIRNSGSYVYLHGQLDICIRNNIALSELATSIYNEVESTTKDRSPVYQMNIPKEPSHQAVVAKYTSESRSFKGNNSSMERRGE